MSTSDAAERRSVGRETEPPLRAERATTPTAREPEETLSSSNVTEKHTERTKPRFSLKLDCRPSETAQSILRHFSDTSTKSFHRPFPACGENISYHVHDLAVHAVDKIPLPLKTVKETKGYISIETSSRTIQSFPNGLRGPYRTNASLYGEPAKRANSLDLTVDKARAEELLGHSTMLSSTVVTAMAPQWSGRLRRSKREEMSDFQGNLQSRMERSSGVERMLSSELQSRQRAPFVRSNTVGWSTRSGPTSLDNERTMLTSASLDNKRTNRPIPSPLSPLSPHSPLSPLSPMSIDLNEPQRSPQRGHSPLSSKPTTSSMLLSLRRVNSPMSLTENQTQSPENVDPNRQFSTHYTQHFQHTNQLSPTSISSNGNASHSPSPTHRDGPSKLYSYSTVPTKHTESPYSQCNISKDVMPPQRSLSRDHPDSISKKPLTLPKRTPYDHTALLKSNSTPRRPLLSTITWMPTDTKESSTQVTSNINNKSNMRLSTEFNNNDNHKDNTGIRGEVPNYRGNKNRVELSGNMTPQGGPAITDNSPNHQSSQLKTQIDSRWNRDPPKPMSLPGALSNSKFSIAATHTTVSQAIPTNPNTSSGLYTAKGGEFTPSLLSPKGSYTPTDNSSKYPNMYSALKTPSAMPQYKEKLTKQSHLNDITNAVTNANYKSSFDLGQSSKTSCSSISGSREEPLSPKFTPLGFERSYVPKPYQPKTNLSPTFGLYSKTNYSPSHNGTTSSSSSYLSPQIPPVTVSALLTPPTTPNDNSPSSPRTPSPKPNRAHSNSMDCDPKIQNSKGEKKPPKRVTFDDTVDTKTEEKKQETLNQLSPRNVKAPSIFNVLRSGNPPNLFSPTPKSSSIQVGAGTKYRSMSSDSAEIKSREMYKQLSTDTFDHKMHGLNTPRQERTLSAESATQYRCSAPLSLPPDFSNGYKNRYSSPPYSTLVTSRTSQQESKTKPPHSPFFQRHSHPNCANVTSSIVKNPLLTTGSVYFRPVQIDLKDSPKDLNLDQVNNNPIKLGGQVLANGKIQLVDNRVQVSSQSLPGDKSPRISSCVTETLVYTVRGRQDWAIDGPKTPPKTTAIMPVAKDFLLCQQIQRKEVLKEQDNMSNLSSSSSVESQNIDDDNPKKKIKEIGKSRFYSIESNSEQSPKRSRFALKKSSSTPNAGLIRFESEKTSKMDQMISKIKKTFSSKKPNNEEELFPSKWKKASQAPSLSVVSDSSTSDVTVESNKTLEEEDVTMELNNNDKEVEDMQRWANNTYTIVQTPKEKNKMGQDNFSTWSDEVMADTDEMQENRSSPHLRMHSPNQDLKAFDYKPNQFLSPNDSNSVYSFNSSSALRKSSSSPRSPLSPFPSLSPASPFSSSDMLDDSVFYSPKPPRQRDSSSSPCELGEISLVSSRRNRASTGPPSAGPVTSKERMSNSYADLKYGIEPGKSFSVSSVLSSRPSGPGRISTGSRFMSVGDLTKASTFSCGHTTSDLENLSGHHGLATRSQSGSCSNNGKVRSRSLPRSFTQLSSWSAGHSASSPAWGQSMDIVDIPWDTEGPPTPPPTPPLSPVTRRMSKPRCLSPPSFSGQSDSPQDGQFPRGHLPSRGYLSSLSTFEESSDSSSDTTTDDEYYLETGEDEEKETEL